VTGKSFAFAAVSVAQYREGLAAAGLPPFVVDAVLSIQDMWSVGGFDVTTGDVERLAVPASACRSMRFPKSTDEFRRLGRSTMA
jgi:hypothetical protein